MEPETTRGFIHFSRTWYAQHNNHRDGMIDLVTFGDWCKDGSGDGEINMAWYTQGVRLECFSDSWFSLAGMSDLISTLGNLAGEAITPYAFCELLTALGFEDRTLLDRCGTTPASQAQAEEEATPYPAYHHSDDYGWLKVSVTPIGDGRARITATSGDELLIADEGVRLCELTPHLPADVMAFNEPILGERQNGMPDWLICPNCEHGQPATPDTLITCRQCGFVFISPAPLACAA